MRDTKDMYKLRFYIKRKGMNQGNLDHEEFFNSKDKMDRRYHEVFIYEDYSLNPTAWERNSKGNYERLLDY